ncbi:MAG: hypothetical protein ABW166_09630 [Sedimenticola sp.]
MKCSEIESKKTMIELETPEGIRISIPVDLMEMSDAERAAFLKFTLEKSLDSLDEKEKELLASRKVYLQGEGTKALICRFDWSCWAV